MALVLITPPAEEPVSLAEVKIDLKVDHDDEDARISLMIAAVRQQLETVTRRAIITQTWDLHLDRWPGAIRIPMPPIQTIDSVKYLDTDGVQQTLATDQYKVLMGEPAYVVPAYQVIWPNLRDENDAVVVRFTTGYGDSSDVPEAMKDWIMAHVSERYCNREAGSASSNTKFIDGLIDGYRLIGFN